MRLASSIKTVSNTDIPSESNAPVGSTAVSQDEYNEKGELKVRLREKLHSDQE